MIYQLGQIAMLGLVATVGIVLLAIAVLLFAILRYLQASEPEPKKVPLFSRRAEAPTKDKIKPVSVSEEELWQREQEEKS